MDINAYHIVIEVSNVAAMFHRVFWLKVAEAGDKDAVYFDNYMDAFLRRAQALGVSDDEQLSHVADVLYDTRCFACAFACYVNDYFYSREVGRCVTCPLNAASRCHMGSKANMMRCLNGLYSEYNSLPLTAYADRREVALTISRLKWETPDTLADRRDKIRAKTPIRDWATLSSHS